MWVVAWVVALAASGCAVPVHRTMADEILRLMEPDFENQCVTQAESDWQELDGKPGALQIKLEADKMYGYFVKTQLEDLKSSVSGLDGHERPQLRRQVELFLKHGDTLLNTDQWNQLVTFSDTVIHHLRFSYDYYCGETNRAGCSLTDLQEEMLNVTDETQLRAMKQSWEQKLPSTNTYYTQILPLVQDAARANEFETVEQYWEALVELEGGLALARRLWAQARPLYEKLRKYVALKLQAELAPDTAIPVHLLGSFIGDSWLEIASKVMPKRAEIFDEMSRNLKLEHLGGREAFNKARTLLKTLNLGDIDAKTLRDSAFNRSCPAEVVDFCPSSVRISTCSSISLSNYLDAHETLMMVKKKELAAVNNSYIFAHANRYSALDEALSGVLSLVAMSPHGLSLANLYPHDRFSQNPNHHRTILQLLIALRDLPRLSYYMAVDEYRLQTLGNLANSLGSSWAQYRRASSAIAPTDKDLLGDRYVLQNKPYLAKTLGIFLKYQVYQIFASELQHDEADIIKHISHNTDRLLKPMKMGFRKRWPQMISATLANREHELEATGLTDYFKLLETFLDQKLSSNSESLDDFDMTERTRVSEPYELEVDQPFEDIESNLIAVPPVPEQVKADIKLPDSTTENDKSVLVPKDSQDASKSEEEIIRANYHMYLWIGIAILAAIILVLLLLVARRRYNHRKELERERKKNTRA